MTNKQLKEAKDGIRKEFIRAMGEIDSKIAENELRKNVSDAAKLIGIMKQEFQDAGLSEKEAMRIITTIIQGAIK